MQRTHWTVNLVKSLLALASGSALLAGSCAADVRDNVVAGGLSFVKGYTVDALEALIPSWSEAIGGGQE